MNEKCKTCNWYYKDSDCCVSERFDEIYLDDTYETDECIGYLREDYFEHMIDMKSRLLVYSPSYEISEYVKNMSYKETLKMYNDIFGKMRNLTDVEEKSFYDGMKKMSDKIITCKKDMFKELSDSNVVIKYIEDEDIWIAMAFNKDTKILYCVDSGRL